jgi:6-phosphogluconolactonase/glucosamine-6-phosphate isomerase/deaminase
MNRTIGNLKVHIFKDKAEAARQVADDISLYLSNAQKRAGKVLFLSSGGSSLAILEFISDDIPGDYPTIGVLDERYDREGKNNNFVQLSGTGFYRKALKSGCAFIDTTVRPGQTRNGLADYFEGKLREWRKNNPDGEIVATIGIGPDGHTSGIMPFPEDKERFDFLFNGERWVMAYDATGKTPYPERVTTTNTFLKLIDRAFVFAVGREKAEAFRHMQEDRPVSEVPAAILKELRGDMYIDRELSEVVSR